MFQNRRAALSRTLSQLKSIEGNCRHGPLPKTTFTIYEKSLQNWRAVLSRTLDQLKSIEDNCLLCSPAKNYYYLPYENASKQTGYVILDFGLNF